MKTTGKILLTLGLTAAAMALILWGGKLMRAKDAPQSAFEAGRRMGRQTEYYADDPQSFAALPREEMPASTAAPLPKAAEPRKTPALPAASPAPQEASAHFGQETVLLTFLGIDTDPSREARGMGWRSDAIVICFVDTKTPACTLLTVPRDTRARIRRLNADGEVRKTQWGRINAAYAYGGGKDKFSHENALYALSELLDLQLSYYVSIDMDAIGPVTDAVGGVPVTLDFDIDGVGEKGETVTLTGDAAYTYVRRRKGVTGGSDLARTGRQQKFLKALAMKVKEMDAVTAVPQLFSALSGRVRTNLSIEQMAALAGVLDRLEEKDITAVTLPGRSKTIDGTSYYIMDEEKTRETVKKAMGEV